ncbi:hypothetical protein E2C01_064283 [Portunus trituberculatus]|uniref:Uncharacterized protein n=1 Tax=Portunus trituberculatus TaxID=210409 RepID=A0A5B7HLC3_PORTR|nr:hypothetical protein [Portunus trituberculatus]
MKGREGRTGSLYIGPEDLAIRHTCDPSGRLRPLTAPLAPLSPQLPPGGLILHPTLPPGCTASHMNPLSRATTDEWLLIHSSRRRGGASLSLPRFTDLDKSIGSGTRTCGAADDTLTLAMTS